ncbi:MAG: ATP-binding protein [bacterium]
MSLHSLPPLLSGLLFVGLSFFVLRNRRSKSNFTFALLCLVTFWWQFAWFILFNTSDENGVMLIIKAGYTGIIFIPVVYFHFVINFLNLERSNRYRNIVRASYAFGVLLVLILWTTPYIIRGFYRYPWGFYPRAGVLHFLHLLHVSAVTVWMLVLLFAQKKYLQPFFPIKYNQIRYLILGVFAYFPAATDYIVNYGVEFYPLGIIFITANLLITFAAIVRYRLMDVSLVIKRTFVFGLLFGLAIAVMYLPMFVWQEMLRNMLGGAWPIIIGIIFLVILISAFPLYRLLVRLTDRWLFQKKYEYQKTLKEASKGMIEITEPDKLLSIIARFLTRKVRAKHTFILVWDDVNRHYAIKGAYGKTPIEDIRLTENCAIIRWFKKTGEELVKRKLLKKQNVDVLVKEELEDWMDDSGLMEGHDDLEYEFNNILVEMDPLEGSIVIPSFYKGFLLGVLILGDKLSGDIYTQEDLDILSTMANDAAVAVKNAQLFTDLTQEKEKMITVFNNMSDGAVLTDSNLRIIMFNEASCNLLNLSPIDLINREFPEVVKDFKVSVSLRAITKQSARSVMCEMSRQKGQDLFISNRVNRILDEKGNTIGYIMILRDVTQERTEEAQKKNFLALVSHKLRTPLTPIIGYTQLLLMQKDLNDSQREIVQNIGERGQVLTELINELISFTTLDSGTIALHTSPVNIQMVAQDAISSLGGFIAKENAKVTVEDSVAVAPRVSIDKEKILETIKNIVENAIKFNDKKVKTVIISATEAAEGFMQLRIQDNGPGIPGEEFERIFQRFYQVEDGFSGQVAGAGLGLSLVKRIVELHGGKIWVESKLGEGTTFCFTLPLYQEQAGYA